VSESVGIAAVGAYVPHLRVDRAEIATAHEWANPGLRSLARGVRSACSWDEDAITMAVAASRDALRGRDRAAIGAVHLASTTAPYADRLNAGVVAGALGLDEQAPALDLGGSLRAGTSALLAGFDAAAARNSEILCVAADRRQTAPGSTQELTYGHAAAAVVVAPGPGLARLAGRASLTVDFVGHFRAAGRPFDYQWEERWIRDEGYGKLLPRLVGQLLASAGVEAAQIAYLCVPATLRGAAELLAKKTGIPETALRDQLRDGCGDAGAAHPVLQLVAALHDAAPGDLILVVGVGQGGDALLFEATDAVASLEARTWPGAGGPCSYERYLALSGLLQLDRGMRAEMDKISSLTAAYRHRDLLLELVGGRCTACGTYQVPRTDVCVNPDCRAIGAQEPYSFADSTGAVATWSADRLTYTPDPPAYYGTIDFAEGGRLLMDFTDVSGEGVEVGTQMRMVFRVKDYDTMRGFARYFWKAAPIGLPGEG
jgi:hydroxymethylglutaryl-CoA synthase